MESIGSQRNCADLSAFLLGFPFSPSRPLRRADSLTGSGRHFPASASNCSGCAFPKSLQSREGLVNLAEFLSESGAFGVESVYYGA